MNRRQQQKHQHSEYVRKVNARIRSLCPHDWISLRLKREEIDDLFRNKLSESIVRLQSNIRNHQSKPSTKRLLQHLDSLASQVSHSDDLLRCYDELRLIRRKWKRIKNYSS